MTEQTIRACLQPGGPVRPTFCNVPDWGQALVYLLGLLAVVLFAAGLFRHYGVWSAGRSPTPARNAVRRLERWRFLAADVIGQRATFERRLPGIFHAGLFWGFLLLFTGTALATIDWDVARVFLQRRLLAGPFYVGYEFVLDTAGFLFLAALGVAAWRRYIVAPHHVLGAWDFVIWSLVVINASGFMVEGLRLTLAPVAWGRASWLGQALADLLGRLPPGMLLPHVAPLHYWLWLGHMAGAMVFIVAVCFTNAVHILSTAANTALQSLEPLPPGARLLGVDLETAEFYGISRLDEATAKQRLGVDSCVRCGRCETVCPAYAGGTPLNPKGIIVALSRELRDELDKPAWGQSAATAAVSPSIVGEGRPIEPDALWACTTCLACVASCPSRIEILDDIVDMRRYLTLAEGWLPGTAAVALRNMGTAGNPWGYAPEDRLAWADGTGVGVAQPGASYDVLYWVGCAGAYDPRGQRISRAVAALLEAAGVRFAVMAEERCHCESARRLGEEYLFQTAARENVTNLGRYTFRRILTHCPHCYNTLKNEYPQFGASYEVVHHSQLLAQLVADGRLPRAPGSASRAAFHDSCYLGRYNGEYEAPRRLLRAAGTDVVELGRRRRDGFCCGGGGGKMWFEDRHYRTKIADLRLAEALAAGQDRVAVACPYCLTMLDSAAKSMAGGRLEVLDVAEVLMRALAGREASAPTKETG